MQSTTLGGDGRVLPRPADLGSAQLYRAGIVTGPPGLPPGAVAYRRTPVFDENTIPAGLQREHQTRPGVWGLITVINGRLRFRAIEPAFEKPLAAGESIVIAPEQPHEVKADGPVRFYVEFYRVPAALD